METSTVLLILLFAALTLFVPVLLYPNRFMRWFQLKRYQYEVTFSLYMLTPTEKFILNSFVFLTLSMIVIAAALYLPEHIMTMSHRAFYYWSGYSRHAPPHGSHPASVASTSASILAAKVAAVGQNIAIEVARAASAGAEHISERIGEGVTSAAGMVGEL